MIGLTLQAISLTVTVVAITAAAGVKVAIDAAKGR